MTTPLSRQKKGALWRAYKQRPTARYVAITCDISWHTASKYIRELHFPQRLKALQAKASTIVSDDEAKRYADELSKIDRISSSILDTLVETFECKAVQPTTKDADRILRLKRFLRGEPESRAAHDVSILWSDDEDEEEDEADNG